MTSTLLKLVKITGTLLIIQFNKQLVCIISRQLVEAYARCERLVGCSCLMMHFIYSVLLYSSLWSAT
jgi:hypothetical protein